MINMSLHVVEKVINEWDPINLLSHAPADEYVREIEQVAVLLSKTTNIECIAMGIEDVFLKAFGSNVFRCSYNDCLCVAQKLVLELNL